MEMVIIFLIIYLHYYFICVLGHTYFVMSFFLSFFPHTHAHAHQHTHMLNNRAPTLNCNYQIVVASIHLL